MDTIPGRKEVSAPSFDIEAMLQATGIGWQRTDDGLYESEPLAMAAFALCTVMTGKKPGTFLKAISPECEYFMQSNNGVELAVRSAPKNPEHRIDSASLIACFSKFPYLDTAQDRSVQDCEVARFVFSELALQQPVIQRWLSAVCESRVLRRMESVAEAEAGLLAATGLRFSRCVSSIDDVYDDYRTRISLMNVARLMDGNFLEALDRGKEAIDAIIEEFRRMSEALGFSLKINLRILTTSDIYAMRNIPLAPGERASPGDDFALALPWPLAESEEFRAAVQASCLREGSPLRRLSQLAEMSFSRGGRG